MRRETKDRVRPTVGSLAVGIAALLAVGCGGEGRGGEARAAGEATAAAASDLSGRIEADGSSTVGPFTTAAAEQFQQRHSDVQVTVGISGTGGGFERFCAGETDLSNASRPIKEEEIQACEEAGIDYVEFHVVNDGLAVVVNPQNDWVDCFTAEQLHEIWKPGSNVDNWSQVPDANFPDVDMTLAGPGTDSGTFDYFTETVNEEGGASRSDYQASEDDNVVVQAVSGSEGGLGYFGLSYVQENEGKIKAVAIENEQGECVEPSVETVQDGSYNPLGRPLFIYAKQDSFQRPEVQEFVQFLLENNESIAETALYVPLTEEQLQAAQEKLDAAAAEAGA